MVDRAWVATRKGLVELRRRAGAWAVERASFVGDPVSMVLPPDAAGRMFAALNLGHFGVKPIRLAWTGLVFPALALNYLGQGALLMADPGAIENPFFRLFPAALVLPMVGLAALAAVIASQAVISGAYSMTKQAILLGFLPRLTLRHTSASESGQIYVPAVNWALLAGVIAAMWLAYRM